MQFLYILALLALTATCVVSAADVAPAALATTREYDLHLVQVVHRHGSRSALVSYNKTLICPPDYACGYLNAQGQQMMVNIGSFLRDRYTTDVTVVDPATPFLPYDGYNLTVSYTRSTDVLRTLQSADAFLRGLFPNMSAYYPAVHTVYGKSDALLNSGVIPVIRARYDYGDAPESAICDPVVDAYFTQADLIAIGTEVHLGEFCQYSHNRTKCAKELCDVALAYQTTGVLPLYPKLSAHIDRLCAVTAVSSGYYFEYNASNPVHQKQGSLGQALAQEMLSNFRLYINGTAEPFRLIEYSAHDTTISPFASTLGDNSREAMLPPFASTFVLELLTPKASSATAAPSSTEWYVRVLRGHPGVTPATNYTFHFSYFPLRCMDANNATYISEDNVCPLADFTRFVDSSKPTDPAGLCYLDPDLAVQMNCSTDALEDPRSLSSRCVYYRTLCPAVACGDGYHLDANDLGCYRLSDGITTGGLSGGAIAALVVGCLAGGALLAVGGLYIKKHYLDKKSNTHPTVTNLV